MENIIAGEIIYKIGVVGLKYIVHRMHRLLGLLVRAFLEFMQHWITNEKTIRHLSLRCMVKFMIELFLF